MNLKSPKEINRQRREMVRDWKALIGAGTSAKDAAESLGIPLATLRRWDADMNRPHLSTLNQQLSR